MPGIEDAILENFQTFVAFVRKRVGDPHLAEDIVQGSLLKAFAADHKPTEEENAIAWFYRILRRSIIDVYRRTDVRTRALERFARELPEEPSAEDERLLCQCFKKLLLGSPRNIASSCWL
jgi:RNA polymerase sigma factor (sigma-70 family)